MEIRPPKDTVPRSPPQIAFSIDWPPIPSPFVMALYGSCKRKWFSSEEFAVPLNPLYSSNLDDLRPFPPAGDASAASFPPRVSSNDASRNTLPLVPPSIYPQLPGDPSLTYPGIERQVPNLRPPQAPSLTPSNPSAATSTSTAATLKTAPAKPLDLLLAYRPFLSPGIRGSSTAERSACLQFSSASLSQNVSFASSPRSPHHSQQELFRVPSLPMHPPHNGALFAAAQQPQADLDQNLSIAQQFEAIAKAQKAKDGRLQGVTSQSQARTREGNVAMQFEMLARQHKQMRLSEGNLHSASSRGMPYNSPMIWPEQPLLKLRRSWRATDGECPLAPADADSELQDHQVPGHKTGRRLLQCARLCPDEPKPEGRVPRIPGSNVEAADRKQKWPRLFGVDLVPSSR